jgi:histidinol phosphatase-like enzyme (inositol monophosphatase family)
MQPHDLSARLDLARRIAVAAGRHTLTYFQKENYEVERKGDASPVTVADREAEQLLRREIAAAFPADGILGEEFGAVEGTSGYRWILDPIDGTKSFISGVPMYGTMVGVEFEGQCPIGVVYIPGLDEGVYASAGQGCYYWRGSDPPARCRVSPRKSLSQGAFVTSQVDTFAKRGALDAYHALEKSAYITRTWGDCYGYLLVATGRVEAMVDPMMNVWDAAALQPILEEAGGTFTSWSGEPTIHSGDGIGTNGLVVEEVLAITRKFAK